MKTHLLKTMAICALLCAAPSLAATDPVADANRRKAEAEAEKAALEAEKARSEAETAAAKAQFGTLGDYKTAGTTEAGDKAGKMEAQLLSFDAVKFLSSEIVGKLDKTVCPKSNIVIATPDEVLSFEAYDGFKAEFDQIMEEHRVAMATNAPPKPPKGAVRKASSAAALGTTVDIIGNLFRSDYKLAELDWTPDDLLLARAIVASAKPGRWNFFLPKASTSLVAEGNPAVQDMVKLRGARNSAEARIDFWHGDAKQHPKADQTVPIKALEAVIKHIDDFNAAVRTPDKAGAVPLVAIAREAQFADRLKDGFVLVIKSHVGGGTTYTKKNFWTFFGSVPFYVSGGALVSYALLDGNSGQVVDAGAFDKMTQFAKIRTVADRTPTELVPDASDGKACPAKTVADE